LLPAPSFDDILRRADLFGRTRTASDRLVSILFADPGSRVWRDLRSNRAFLDERSGQEWDLFFAGLSAFASPGEPNASRIFTNDPDWCPYFNPRSFSEIEHRVSKGHAQALTRDGSDRRAWSYHGGTDVVSFMVYGQQPDWLSLRSAPLYTKEGEGLYLVHVVEGLAKWQDDNVNPLLAPGEALYGVSRESALLVAALGWTAAAVTGGVLGNLAYDLLLKVLKW